MRWILWKRLFLFRLLGALIIWYLLFRSALLRTPLPPFLNKTGTQMREVEPEEGRGGQRSALRNRRYRVAMAPKSLSQIRRFQRIQRTRDIPSFGFLYLFVGFFGLLGTLKRNGGATTKHIVL